MLNALWVELVSAHIFKVRKSKSLSKIYKKGEVEVLMVKRPVALLQALAFEGTWKRRRKTHMIFRRAMRRTTNFVPPFPSLT